MKNLFIYGCRHKIIAIKSEEFCYLIDGKCIGKFENNILYKLNGDYIADINYQRELWVNPMNKGCVIDSCLISPNVLELSLRERWKIKVNQRKLELRNNKTGNDSEHLLVMGTRHLKELCK